MAGRPYFLDRRVKKGIIGRLIYRFLNDPIVQWPRTAPFHGANTGSTPVGVIFYASLFPDNFGTIGEVASPSGDGDGNHRQTPDQPTHHTNTILNVLPMSPV